MFELAQSFVELDTDTPKLFIYGVTHMSSIFTILGISLRNFCKNNLRKARYILRYKTARFLL